MRILIVGATGAIGCDVVRRRATLHFPGRKRSCASLEIDKHVLELPVK